MFHLRYEGESFKSGISFQYNFGKNPYIAFHWVAYDTASQNVTKKTWRFRFFLKPHIIKHDRSYNVIKHKCQYDESVFIKKTTWEYASACINRCEQSDDFYKRRAKQYAEAMKEYGQKEVSRSRYNVFPQDLL